MKKKLSRLVAIPMFALLVSSALGQVDVLTIDGGEVAAGETATFKIYLLDVSGSGIDTGTQNIGGVNIVLDFSPGLVEDATITPSGDTSDNVSFEFSTFADDHINFGVVYTPAPFFNLDGPSPGDEVATLSITAKAGAAGQTISLIADEDGTGISSELGGINNTITNGGLTFVSSAINVAQGAGTPVINSFSVSPDEIYPGDTAVLSWIVTDADTVGIDHGIGDGLGAMGSIQVMPTETTTYTMTATNGAGSVQRTVTVTVEAPHIDAFTADPMIIGGGESSTLSWDIQGAETATIEPGIGTVDPVSGTVDVMPNETTVYTLVATNSVGSNQRSQAVQVSGGGGGPVINGFSATPRSILPGESATLEWDVFDATSVSIDQSVGDVEPVGSIEVDPIATTTYTLTASNPFGMVTAEATVSVQRDVVVESFTATPDVIRVGEISTLTWETTNAVSAVITPGDMEVDANGSLGVNPTETTEYTLKAIGLDEDSVEAKVTVEVSDTDLEIVSSEESLDFGEQTSTLSFDLSLDVAEPLEWTAEYPEWFSLIPDSGTVGSIAVRVTVNADREDLYPHEVKDSIIEIKSPNVPSLLIPVRLAKTGQPDAGKVLFFPNIVVDDSISTRLEVVNGKDASAKLDIQVFNSNRKLESSTKNVNLPPFGSYQRQMQPLTTREGWAVVTVRHNDPDNGTPLVHGALVGRTADGQELYASSPTTQPSQTLLVPHIAADPNFYTQGTVANLGGEGMLDFQSAGIDDLAIASVELGEQVQFDFREAMGGQIMGAGWGKLNSDADEPLLAGVEVFGRTPMSGLRQAVAVGLDGASANDLTFAHIAADIVTFWTGIVIINTGDAAASVEIKAYDSSGGVIGGGLSESYGPGEKRAYLITGDQMPFGPDASWIRATSSAPLIGYELFGTYDDRFAGFESVRDFRRSLAFPHLEQVETPGGWTGLAIVNPNSVEAQLTMTWFDRRGTVKATTAQAVAGGQKLVGLVSSYFNGPFETGDWIFVESDRPVAGFELFGYGQSLLAAILGGIDG